MQPAALVFRTMAVTVLPEILQEILIQFGFCQKIIVSMNKLQVSFTAYCFCDLFYGLVLFCLLHCFWMSIDFQIQTLIPNRFSFNVTNGRIEFQIDGFHGAM